jgi:hypothetical protein
MNIINIKYNIYNIYMKWYIFYILIGILLYIILTNIDGFSIGNAYEISTWGIEDAEPNTMTEVSADLRVHYPYVPLCDNILNHHKLPINTNIKDDSTNNYNCKYVDYTDAPLDHLSGSFVSSLRNETNDCVLECEKGQEGDRNFHSWEFAPLNVDETKSNKLNIDCKPTLMFYSYAHGQILVINNEINNTDNSSIINDNFNNYYIKYPKIYLENSGISIITLPRTGNELYHEIIGNDLAYNNKSSYNTNPRDDQYTYVQKFVNTGATIPITKQPRLETNTNIGEPYIYQNPTIHPLHNKSVKISGFNKTVQYQFDFFKNNRTNRNYEPKVNITNLQHDVVLKTDYNYLENNNDLVRMCAVQPVLLGLMLFPSYNKIKLLSINTVNSSSITAYLRGRRIGDETDGYTISDRYTLNYSYFDLTNLERERVPIKEFLNHERRFISGIDSDNYLNENEIDLLEMGERKFDNNDRNYMNLNNNYYKLGNDGETNLLLCKTYDNQINEIFIKINPDNDWGWVSITDLNLEYYFLNVANCTDYANEAEIASTNENIEWPILYYWSTLYYIHAYINYKSLKPYLQDCLNVRNTTIFDIDMYKNTKLFNKDSFINNTPKCYLSYYSKHNNTGFSSSEPDGTQKSLIGEYTKLLDYDLLCHRELDAFYRLFNTDNFDYIDVNSFHEKEISKYQTGINDYERYLNEKRLGYEFYTGGLGDDPEKNEYLKELMILQYNKNTLKSTNFGNLNSGQVLYRKYKYTLLLSDIVFYCKNLQLDSSNNNIFNIQIYLHSCLTISNDVQTKSRYLDSQISDRFKLESYYYNPDLEGHQLNYLKSGTVDIFQDSERIYSSSEKNINLEDHYSDSADIDRTDGGAVDWKINYTDEDTNVPIDNFDESGGMLHDTNHICKLPEKCKYYDPVGGWPPTRGINSLRDDSSPHVVLTNSHTVEDGSVLVDDSQENEPLDRPNYKLTKYIYNDDDWDWKDDGRLNNNKNIEGNTKYVKTVQPIYNKTYNAKCQKDYQKIQGSDDHHTNDADYRCGYLSQEQLDRLYNAAGAVKPNKSHLCKVVDGITDCSKPLTLRCSSQDDPVVPEPLSEDDGQSVSNQVSLRERFRCSRCCGASARMA